MSSRMRHQVDTVFDDLRTLCFAGIIPTAMLGPCHDN